MAEPLFRDRPEWADVTPIPQDDGPLPLVQIRYTESFVDCHDYFRAVLKSGEKSERVLELTCVVIDHNSANYTAWYHRRLCLKALAVDLQDELTFTESWMHDSPKNYKVWSHRQWVVSTFELYGGELDYTKQLIDE